MENSVSFKESLNCVVIVLGNIVNRRVRCFISKLLFRIILAAAALSDGELGCIQRVPTTCQKEVWEEGKLLQNYDLCTIYPKSLNCMTRELNKCGLQDLAKRAKNAAATVNEVCKDGTDLNKEYQDHKECLNKFIQVAPMDCLKKFSKLFADLEDPSEANSFDFYKAFCNNFEKTKECTFQNIRDQCGADTEGFFRSLNANNADFQEKLYAAVLKHSSINLDRDL